MPEPPSAAPRRVRLTVNGSTQERRVEPRRTLADFLRHDLQLTGTHVGCEHGVCGCCTVLLDGLPVRSCLLLAVQAQGAAVTTIEGLAPAQGSLHPLQLAFVEGHGLQCGFCTPGILLTALVFLREHPDPGEADVREMLAGNLCRCTGYQNIVHSILLAAARLRAGPPVAAEVRRAP